MRIHPEGVVPTDPGSPAHEDDAWVARLGSDEGSAAEAWVRSRAGALLPVADRHLRDVVASEAVVRDVLLRALRAVSDGEGDAASWAALRRETLGVVLARLRHGPPDPGCIEPLLPRFRADGTHAEVPRPWDAHGGPGARALPEVLRGCIERLPELHRVVLMMADGERLEAGFIARGLGMSEERVKTTLHEARLALRTLLVAQEGRASPRSTSWS
jgi:RNA polymerase sigma-70 factor (ECF subfamily)